MGKGFFDDHKHLGAMFDYDRDGRLDAGEFGGMAAFGSMAAKEMEKATRDDDPWRDDDDDDFGEDDDEDDPPRKRGRRRRREHLPIELDFDWSEVNPQIDWSELDEEAGIDEDELYRRTEHRLIKNEILGSLWDDDYRERDIRDAIDAALSHGVRFAPDEICDLSQIVEDPDQMASLILTSDPLFPETLLVSLGYTWSGLVRIDYDEETDTIVGVEIDDEYFD